MHILYFHQHFATPRGSLGTRSWQIARRLIDCGHQVTMVCGLSTGSAIGLEGPYRHGARRGVVDGIDVIELDLPYDNTHGFIRRSASFLSYAWRSLLIALREPCDLVFATSTPLTASIPGIAARWLRRKPFVFEVRDLWPEVPRAMGIVTNPVVLGLMSILEWVSYRSAHRLIGLSPGIVEGIQARAGATSRVIMVPNGCDLDTFGEHAARWRPPGIDAGNLLAVYAGRLGYAQGFEALIEVARVLKTRGRDDIRLLLVGDGARKPDLMATVEAEQLSSIVFHAPVNKDRVAGLLSGADIGLMILSNLPEFYYGTSPNKFFDYIAAGLPVLNNYPGWVAELLSEHQAGFAVPPDDANAFADALEQAADDREALTTFGHNARALAREQFDRDLLTQRWIEWVTGTPAALASVGQSAPAGPGTDTPGEGASANKSSRTP